MAPKRAVSPKASAAPDGQAAKKPAAKASPKPSVAAPDGSPAKKPASKSASPKSASPSPADSAAKSPSKAPAKKKPSAPAATAADGSSPTPPKVASRKPSAKPAASPEGTSPSSTSRAASATAGKKVAPSPKKAPSSPAAAATGDEPVKKAPLAKTSSKLSKAPPSAPSKDIGSSGTTSRAASVPKSAVATPVPSSTAKDGSSPLKKRTSSASPTKDAAEKVTKDKVEKKEKGDKVEKDGKGKEPPKRPSSKLSSAAAAAASKSPGSAELGAIAVSSNASMVFELDGPLDATARPTDILTSLDAIYSYDPRSHLLNESLRAGLGKFYFAQDPIPPEALPLARDKSAAASMERLVAAGARGVIPAVCPVRTTCHIRDVRHTHAVSDSLLSLFSYDGNSCNWESLSKLAPVVPSAASDRPQSTEAVQFRTALKQLFTAFTTAKTPRNLPVLGTIQVDPTTLAVSVSGGNSFSSLVDKGRVQRNGVQFSNLVFQVPVNPEYAEWEVRVRAAWREKRRDDMLKEKSRRAAIAAATPPPAAATKAVPGKKSVVSGAAAPSPPAGSIRLDPEEELQLELEDKMYFDESDPVLRYQRLEGSAASNGAFPPPQLSTAAISSLPLSSQVDLQDSTSSAAICKSLLADALCALGAPPKMIGHPKPFQQPTGLGVRKGLPVNVVVVTDGDFSVEPIVKPKDPRLGGSQQRQGVAGEEQQQLPAPAGLRSVRDSLLGKNVGDEALHLSSGGETPPPAADIKHIVTTTGMDSLHQIGVFFTRAVHEFLQAHEMEIVAAAALVADAAPPAPDGGGTVSAADVSPVTFSVGLGELVLHPQTCRNGAEALGGMCDILSTGFPDASLYRRANKHATTHLSNHSDSDAAGAGSTSALSASDDIDSDGSTTSSSGGSSSASSSSLPSSSIASSTSDASRLRDTVRSGASLRSTNRAGERKLRVALDPCLGLEDEMTMVEEESGYRGLVSSQQMRQILKYQERKGMTADGIIHGKPSKKLIRQLGLRVRDFYPEEDDDRNAATSTSKANQKSTDPALRRFNKRFNFIAVEKRGAIAIDQETTHGVDVPEGEASQFPAPLYGYLNSSTEASPSSRENAGDANRTHLSPGFFGYQCCLRDILEAHPLHFAPPAMAHLAILEHLNDIHPRRGYHTGSDATTATLGGRMSGLPHELQAAGLAVTTRSRTVTSTTTSTGIMAGVKQTVRAGASQTVTTTTIPGMDERYTPGTIALSSCVEVAPWWTVSVSEATSLAKEGGLTPKRASVVTLDDSNPSTSRAPSLDTPKSKAPTSPKKSSKSPAGKTLIPPPAATLTPPQSALAGTNAAHRKFALELAAATNNGDVGLPVSAVEFDHSNPVMAHLGRVALLGSVSDATSNGATINTHGGSTEFDTLRSEIDKGHMLNGLRLTAPAVVGLPIAGSYKQGGITPSTGAAIESTINHRQKVRNLLGCVKEAFERDIVEKCLYAISTSATTSSSTTLSGSSGGRGTRDAVDLGMSAGFVLSLCLKVKKPRTVTTTETIAAPSSAALAASPSPKAGGASPKKAPTPIPAKKAAAAPTTRVITRTILEEVVVGQLNVTVLQRTGAVPPPPNHAATNDGPDTNQKGGSSSLLATSVVGGGVGLSGATLLSAATDLDSLVNGWESYPSQQVFGDGTIVLPPTSSGDSPSNTKPKQQGALAKQGTAAAVLGYEGMLQDAFVGERTGLLSFLSGLQRDLQPPGGSEESRVLHRKTNPVRSIVSAILASSGFISTVVQLHNRERKTFEQTCTSLATLQRFFAAHRSFIPLAALPLKQFCESVSALEVGRVAASASQASYNYQRLAAALAPADFASDLGKVPALSSSSDAADKKEKKDKVDKDKKSKKDDAENSPEEDKDEKEGKKEKTLSSKKSSSKLKEGLAKPPAASKEDADGDADRGQQQSPPVGPAIGAGAWAAEKVAMEAELVTLREAVRSQQSALQEVHLLAATSPALTTAFQTLLQASAALASAKQQGAPSLAKTSSPTKPGSPSSKAVSPSASATKSPPSKSSPTKVSSKLASKPSSSTAPAATPAGGSAAKSASAAAEQDAVAKAIADLTKLIPPSLPLVLESALKGHLADNAPSSSSPSLTSSPLLSSGAFATRAAELYAQNTYLGGQNAQLHLRTLELQRTLEIALAESGALASALRNLQRTVAKKDEQIAVMQEMLKSVFSGSGDKLRGIMNSVFEKMNKRGGKKAKLGAGSASTKSSVKSKVSFKTAKEKPPRAETPSPPAGDGGESPSKNPEAMTPRGTNHTEAIPKKKVAAAATVVQPRSFLRPAAPREVVVIHNEASLFGPVTFLRGDAPARLLRQKVSEATAFKQGGVLALNSAKQVSENEERALCIAKFGEGRLPSEMLRDHQARLKEVAKGLQQKLRLLSKGKQGPEVNPVATERQRSQNNRLGYYGYSDDGGSSSEDDNAVANKTKTRGTKKTPSNSNDSDSDDVSESSESERSSLTSISRFTVSSTRYDAAPLQDLGDESDFFGFGPKSTLDIAWKAADPYSSFFKFLAALRRQGANREGLRFLSRGGAVITTKQAAAYPHHPRTNTTVAALMMSSHAAGGGVAAAAVDIGTRAVHGSHSDDNVGANLEIPDPPARVYDPMVKLSDVYSFLEEYHRRFSEEILFGNRRMEDCMLPTYTGGPRMLGAVDITMLRRVAVGVVLGEDDAKTVSGEGRAKQTAMQGLASIELRSPSEAAAREANNAAIAAGGSAYANTRTGAAASAAVLRGGTSHRKLLIQQFSDMMNPMIPDEYVPRVTEVSIQGTLFAGSTLVATYEVPTPAFAGAGFTKVNVRWMRLSAHDPDGKPFVVKGSRASLAGGGSGSGGDTFYKLTDDDVGHYILVECTPVNSHVGTGLSIVAKSKVPVCSDVPTVTKVHLTFTPSAAGSHHPPDTPRVASPLTGVANCYVGDRLQICFSLSGVPLNNLLEDAKETRVLVRWQRAAAGPLSTTPVPTDYFTFAEQVLDLATAKANFEFFKKEQDDVDKASGKRSSPHRPLPLPLSLLPPLSADDPSSQGIGPGGVKNILFGSQAGLDIASASRPEVVSAYRIALYDEAGRIAKLMSANSGSTFVAFLFVGPEVAGCHIRAEVTPIRGVEVSMERAARERLLVQLEQRRDRNRMIEEETMAQAEFDGVLEKYHGTIIKERGSASKAGDQQHELNDDDVLSSLVPAKVRRRIHFAEELIEVFQQRAFPSPISDPKEGYSIDVHPSSKAPYDASFIGAAVSTRGVYVNVPTSVERLVLGALGSGGWSGAVQTEGSGLVRVSLTAGGVRVTPLTEDGKPPSAPKGSTRIPGEVFSRWSPMSTSPGPQLQIPPLFDPLSAAAYYRRLVAADTMSLDEGTALAHEPSASDVDNCIVWLVLPVVAEDEQASTTKPSSSSAGKLGAANAASPSAPLRFKLSFEGRANRDLFVLLFVYFSMTGRNRAAFVGVFGEALSNTYIYRNGGANASTPLAPPVGETDKDSGTTSEAAQALVSKLDERLEEKALELMDFPHRELPGCEYSLMTLISEYLAANPLTFV